MDVSGLRALGQEQGLESGLDVEGVAVGFTADREPDLTEKLDELAAAGEEHVLAVINLDPVDFEGRCLSTGQPRPLEDLYRQSAALQLDRGCQPGQPGADNRYTALSHEPNMTLSFVRFRRRVRCRSGSNGSSSILVRIFRYKPDMVRTQAAARRGMNSVI